MFVTSISSFLQTTTLSSSYTKSHLYYSLHSNTININKLSDLPSIPCKFSFHPPSFLISFHIFPIFVLSPCRKSHLCIFDNHFYVNLTSPPETPFTSLVILSFSILKSISFHTLLPNSPSLQCYIFFTHFLYCSFFLFIITNKFILRLLSSSSYYQSNYYLHNLLFVSSPPHPPIQILKTFSLPSYPHIELTPFFSLYLQYSNSDINSLNKFLITNTFFYLFSIPSSWPSFSMLFFFSFSISTILCSLPSSYLFCTYLTYNLNFVYP